MSSAKGGISLSGHFFKCLLKEGVFLEGSHVILSQSPMGRKQSIILADNNGLC